MAEPYILSPLSLTSFYDPYSGAVLQAKLYFYKAGTLDAITVYTDATLGVPYAQPVLTGGSGRVPPVWIIGTAPYRVRAFDQYDTLLEDIDNMPGAVAPPVDPDAPVEPVDPLVLWKTGFMFASFTNGASTIFAEMAVRCNGNTIGSAASGASERANADTEDLFKFLWQQSDLSGNPLAVIPSKGTTSDGDWLANKQMTLPDLRARAVIGIDDMGSGFTTGRMAGITLSTGTITQPGCTGGAASYTLTTEQIPSHLHELVDPKHAHVSTVPAHNHGATGASDAQGLHQHNYDRWEGGGGGVRWTYDTTPTSQREAVQRLTTAAGSHFHNISVAVNASGPWDIATTEVLTGITMKAWGGKAPVAPATEYVTQPYQLAQPFIGLTWFIHL